MLIDVLPYLRCPVCGGPLARADRGVRCPRGHNFDVARQGYVHLGTGRSRHAGDTAEMVAARAEFLAAGGYDFLSRALADAARGGGRAADAGPGTGTGVGSVGPRTGSPGTGSPGGLVVDVGAGTGHHLSAVLGALPDTVGLALDVSKPALRRAARAHPRAAAALADIWGRLPVADAAATVLLNVFAPRNGAEFRRILRDDGVLVVATPTAGHLGELVDRLGLLRVDPDKVDRVAASITPWFTPAEEVVHAHRLVLTRPQVRALIAMGPSAWHIRPGDVAAVADLPEPVEVTASVRVTRYHPHRADPGGPAADGHPPS